MVGSQLLNSGSFSDYTTPHTKAHAGLLDVYGTVLERSDTKSQIYYGTDAGV
jgi:hypothetical protein